MYFRHSTLILQTVDSLPHFCVIRITLRRHTIISDRGELLSNDRDIGFRIASAIQLSRHVARHLR